MNAVAHEPRQIASYQAAIKKAEDRFHKIAVRRAHQARTTS